MQGTVATAILAFVNAIPPTSHVGGDRLAVVFVPGTDTFLFVVGAQECASGVLQVPRGEIRKSAGVPI